MVQAGLVDRVKEERHNLFSNLLAANDEDVEVNLSISEVVGEIFALFPHLHRTSHTPTRQAMYSFINWQAMRQQPIPLPLHLQFWHYILTNRRSCTSMSRMYSQLIDLWFVCNVINYWGVGLIWFTRPTRRSCCSHTLLHRCMLLMNTTFFSVTKSFHLIVSSTKQSDSSLP